MFLKTLKNSEKYHWTEHVKYKMKYYGLSPQRIIRVIRNPQRIEEGIVEKTIAVMQPSSTRIKNGKNIWSQEIWAMYQIKRKTKKVIPETPARIALPACNDVATSGRQIKAGGDQPLAEKTQTLANQKIRIISVWRYPGVSPKRDPIPDDILRELESTL